MSAQTKAVQSAGSAGTFAYKSKKKLSPWMILIYVFLIIMAVLYLAPFLWIILVSLKTKTEVISNPFGLPETWNWGNYSFAWTAGKLGIATLNSFIVCSVTLIATMILGSMAAFAISTMRWKLSRFVLLFFLMGMMIPIHCVLFPLYTHFSAMGLSDSLVGLMIPYLTFGLPVTIFIMVGFFDSLPHEMLEAACMDGCSIYKYFLTIALPLCRTGLFVTGMMTFIGNWNELLTAMIFIADDLKKTLPVALTKFAGPHSTNYSQQFAAIVIAVLPTIVVYCLFSNQIVDGLTTGAVKG